MKDNVKVHGRYDFYFDDGRHIYYDNVVVQNFFTAVISALNGTNSDIEITDFATGDGTNTAMKSDTALQNELFRKALSSKSTNSTQYIAKLSLGASESVFTIKEIGVFAGTTLISRCNVNEEKNASTQLLIVYTLTIS